MARVARVEFGGPARYVYCAVPEGGLHHGDVVVVETDWGVGMGEVGAILPDVCPDRLQSGMRPFLRKATPIDLSRRLALSQREREARDFCRERIQARGLPMKLTEVRIGLDSSKAMFYFTADGRVDFRELVKDLIQHLRTRVELRQIGVRDEAKVLGSSGPCGRAVCCHCFLQAFAPVSIRMAKDQNLALNPGKLSGMCGRLKCCLAFEHPLYAELKCALPKMGCRVSTCRGSGLVRGQNILEQTVVVGLETGGQVTLRVEEVQARPRSDAPARGQAERDTPADDGDAAPGGAQASGPAQVGRNAPRRGGRSRRPRPQGPPPPQEQKAEEIPADVAMLEDR